MYRRNVLRCGLAAVLPLPVTMALAQRDDSDRGRFEIIGARYGTPSRNVDVTDRLRRLARMDRSFRVTNDILGGGDPDEGRVKTLRIYARGPRGATRVFEYREGDVIDGDWFVGWRGGDWGRGARGDRWDDDDRRRGRDRAGYREDRGRIEIIQATYGAGRRSRDVTARMRDLARDGYLDFQVSNDAFGIDPAPGQRKSLWVTYSTRRGGRQQVRVDEDDRLRLP